MTKAPTHAEKSTNPKSPDYVPLHHGGFCALFSLYPNEIVVIPQNLCIQQEAQRATYRAPEYNVPPFWQIGQGIHLVFPIGPQKNTNLVEEIEILLPVKFRWIPFSGFRWDVENVSANQRPGWPSCFSDRPEKHKLGRRHGDIASCQLSLNSVQQFRGYVDNVSANQRQGQPSSFFD